ATRPLACSSAMQICSAMRRSVHNSAQYRASAANGKRHTRTMWSLLPSEWQSDRTRTQRAYLKRSKPETCRLDRAQRQEFDGNLRNPRPRRSFLWRKHNPEELSEGAVRRDERSHRDYAKAGIGRRGRDILE